MDIIPIIELYEYQIHKYKPTDIHTIKKSKNKNLYKFNDIDDSPDSECKRISIDGSQDNIENDTNKSSCDPIYSVGGSINPYSLYNIDNIYGNYKLFLANNTDTEELDDKSIDILLTNITNAINNQISNINSNNNPTLDYLFSQIINKKDDIFSLNNYNMNESILHEFQNQTAIIQNINIQNDEKIILFGDLHGSFHTFFRNLCRLHRYGIINLETFEINDKYIIIFLGDILDRGMYSLDILNIIFKLIYINNKNPNKSKIIYNRGNHENYDQYQYKFLLGFDDEPIASNEFYKKIINKDKFNEFIIKFNFLLCILSSAVIINNTELNKKFWCCHGGFPRESILTPINISHMYNLVTNINMSKDIRWSDFGDDINLDYGSSSRGSTLVTYSITGTKKFLDTNNIDFIIRGHQDSYDNSILFNKEGDIFKINNPYNKNIKNILYYNDTLKKFGYRVMGPISRLIADKKHYTDIYPVLTISTNTDNKRYLNSDSFALLKFNITNNTITDFSKNTLSIINTIKDILKKSNINKGDIIKNNLETTHKIYQFYVNDNYILFHKILFDDVYEKYRHYLTEDIINKIVDLHLVHDDIIKVSTYYRNKIIHMNTKFKKIDIDNDNKKNLTIYIQNLIKLYNDISNTDNNYKNKYSNITENEIIKNINKYILDINVINNMKFEIDKLISEYNDNNN